MVVVKRSSGAERMGLVVVVLKNITDSCGAYGLVKLVPNAA